MTLVPEALAEASVRDVDGRPTRLGDRWLNQDAVLVFVRHFG